MTVWEFIISGKQPCVLLYVIQSMGSSPGRQGFKMAVGANGTMCGSIGGGIMEHKFVELAKDYLRRQHTSSAVYRQVHDARAGENRSGMICSGEQTIVVFPIRDAHLPAIRQVAAAEAAHKNGSLLLTNSGIWFKDRAAEQDFSVEINGEQFQYIEKTGLKNQLYIVGGGHCALALSKLMRELGFYVRVFDDRANLHTMEQNHFAHEKTVVSSYAQMDSHIPTDGDTYVVIMTFGYRTDELAIRSLLQRSFTYCGVLGSEQKMIKLKMAFEAEGTNGPLLKNMFAPIGLSINSRTPGEIAVSIAAEIIREKNKQLL